MAENEQIQNVWQRPTEGQQVLWGDPATAAQPLAVQPVAARPGWTARARLLSAVGLVAVGAVAGGGIARAAFTTTRTTANAVASGTAGRATGLGTQPLGGYPFGNTGGTGTGSATGGTGTGSATGGTGTTTGGDTSGSATTDSIAAKVDPGLVDINTTLTGGAAAGTGMVLTATGEILTNNHVIDGATSISVTDLGNGKSYVATVVGYDRTDDIAVLQLVKASGLSTVSIATSTATVGSTVVGIGNAGGTGGTPSTAAGTVTAVGQSITASDEYGGTSEKLTNLIATDADIQAGDSGGPLVNSAGQVIGIDTAGSVSSGELGTSFGNQGSTAQGFAIPIASAITLAHQIESGQASTVVHIGSTAEVGVYIAGVTRGAETVSGAIIAQVVSGGPADTAGVTAGSTVTSLAGHSVTSADDLSSAITALRPGQSVSVAWTDQDGTNHTGNLTLGTGVPQ